MPVSVILVSYNRARLLERAIKSVFVQRGVNTEIIVVDDGSDPPLATMLEKSLLERVELIRNPVRYNAAFARNRGVEAASGDVLAFLDSDDTWSPEHLSTALAELDNSRRTALYVAPVRPSQTESDRLIFEPGAEIYEARFGQKKAFRTSGLVCPAHIFHAVGGFDPQLEKHQDWDFVLRLGWTHPVIYGSLQTVMIDSEAEGRISYRSNAGASEYFLRKHSGKMSYKQIISFLEHVVIRASNDQNPSDLMKIRELVQAYVRPADLGWKARVVFRFGESGRKLMRVKAVLNRFRGRNVR